MIIFGTRGVRMNAGSGTFLCPACRRQQPYHQKKLRRFFTLYFIPIIPLDVIQEYVECDECKGTYKPTVLSITASQLGATPASGSIPGVPGRTSAAPPPPPGVAPQDVRSLCFRGMSAIAQADGNIDDLEADVAMSVMRSLGLDLDRAKVKGQMASSADRDELMTRLRSFGPRLGDKDKEQIARTAYMVAMSDGRIGDAERALLAQMAKEIGLPASQLDSTLGAKIARA